MSKIILSYGDALVRQESLFTLKSCFNLKLPIFTLFWRTYDKNLSDYGINWCTVQSDLDLLLSNGWINDQLIGFYLEFLQNEKYLNHPDVLLVGAEVTQLVKLLNKEEAIGILESIGFTSKGLVLLPVNSLNSPEEAGGSHWSLLGNSEQFFKLTALWFAKPSLCCMCRWCRPGDGSVFLQVSLSNALLLLLNYYLDSVFMT